MGSPAGILRQGKVKLSEVSVVRMLEKNRA